MYYQKIIKEIVADMEVDADDRTIAGIEANMRLEHGTLDALPRDLFRREIRLALECEDLQPGYLRKLAASFGL